MCEKISKTDFQDDGCGGHLGFPSDTGLAHFDLENDLLLQCKVRLKSTKGLWRDVENWFSRWRLWQPSWTFDRLILAILCLLGAPTLLIKFQLKWIIVFRGEFSTFFHINVLGPYKCMEKQIWLCREKVKRQRRTIILAILVGLPSPMICAKIRPKGLFGSGEDF